MFTGQGYIYFNLFPFKKKKTKLSYVAYKINGLLLLCCKKNKSKKKQMLWYEAMSCLITKSNLKKSQSHHQKNSFRYCSLFIVCDINHRQCLLLRIEANVTAMFFPFFRRGSLSMCYKLNKHLFFSLGCRYYLFNSNRLWHLIMIILFVFLWSTICHCSVVFL